MGPKCNHEYPFKKEAERDFIKRAEDSVRMEAERFEDAMLLGLKKEKEALSQRIQLLYRHRNRFFPRSSRENTTLTTPWF